MTAQSFAYEMKGNSAVIWRCFSHDTRAEVPQEIEGLPVTEIAPYTFSAHMDERMLEKGIREGRIRIYVPEALRTQQKPEDASLDQLMEPTAAVSDRTAESKAASQELMTDLPPALCGSRVEEVVFPSGISRVGRYCFYNCENLQVLEYHAKLADWGSGVFTGCHKVRKLRVCIPESGVTYLKPVLEELREELMVEYIPEHILENSSSGITGDTLLPGQDCAYLVFPEFYEEGIENTPARILEERVHGTGVHYRNCFYNKVFDFRQYDSLFPYAVTQESSQTMAELTMGRLRYPYSLSEQAREQYTQYVRSHATELAELLLSRRDMDGIRWLFATVGQDAALMDYITERAAALQYAEALSYLMEYRRAAAKPVRRRREL